MLGPTYPKFSVDPPFAKPAEVIIRVHEDAVPGEYVIAVDTSNVPDEQNDVWLSQYRVNYKSAAASPIRIRPHWRINIEVVG